MLEMQLLEINIEKIDSIVKEHLKDNNQRYLHSIGVAKQAKKLAIKYNLDGDKAYVAGLIHDFRKYDNPKKYKNVLTKEELAECTENPVLYHSYLGAYASKSVFNIEDDDIFNSIKYHVFGRVNMSLFESIIMISDYTEETRTYTDCIKCREILNKDGLDSAIEFSLRKTIMNLLDRGIAPGSNIYEIHKEYEGK